MRARNFRSSATSARRGRTHLLPPTSDRPDLGASSDECRKVRAAQVGSRRCRLASAPGGGPGSQGQAGELRVAADRLALRAGGGVLQADTGRQPEPAAWRTSGQHPSCSPCSSRGAATPHRSSSRKFSCAAATAPAATPRASSGPAVPGSDRFTDAKSGRARAGSTAHPRHLPLLRGHVPAGDPQPRGHPTGVPGQARRTAATAPAACPASSDSATQRLWRRADAGAPSPRRPGRLSQHLRAQRCFGHRPGGSANQNSKGSP